jgi:hypothetical protein
MFKSNDQKGSFSILEHFKKGNNIFSPKGAEYKKCAIIVIVTITISVLL